MADFVRRRILGRWKDGFSLDLHTISSVFLGHDEFGHPRFDTTRSEIGELLYRLKIRADESVIPEIVAAVEALIQAWMPPVDMLVPVPPSTRRKLQPVLALSRAICKNIGVPLADCVRRTREVPQLKNVFDLDERAKLLEGLHSVDRRAVQGKSILLFDDLFRSGATMNAITAELFETGEVKDVYALTITQTRRNR